MTAPSPHLDAAFALARAVRARPRGGWRPSWGRIAALSFSLGAWSLAGWGLAALLRAWS